MWAKRLRRCDGKASRSPVGTVSLRALRPSDLTAGPLHRAGAHPGELTGSGRPRPASHVSVHPYQPGQPPVTVVSVLFYLTADPRWVGRLVYPGVALQHL